MGLNLHRDLCWRREFLTQLLFNQTLRILPQDGRVGRQPHDHMKTIPVQPYIMNLLEASDTAARLGIGKISQCLPDDRDFCLLDHVSSPLPFC